MLRKAFRAPLRRQPAIAIKRHGEPFAKGHVRRYRYGEEDKTSNRSGGSPYGGPLSRDCKAIVTTF